MSGPTHTQVHVTHAEGRLIAHGSAVAWEGRGVLMVGPSGSGKSALALSLMALGATLIGDDRVEVTLADVGIGLAPPPEIEGRIEARGLGLLAAKTTSAPLAVVIDLGTPETERLPPHRTATIEGREVPCLHAIERGYFPAAIAQYLTGGRYA